MATAVTTTCIKNSYGISLKIEHQLLFAAGVFLFPGLGDHSLSECEVGCLAARFQPITETVMPVLPVTCGVFSSNRIKA